MKTVLFCLTSLFTLQVVMAQEPILINPTVGSEIDLTEKKQYRLFPYYSSQLFVSSSIYMMPDSTMQLKTKMIHDSTVTRPFSKQELTFLRNMTGSSEVKKTPSGETGPESAANKGAYISFGVGYNLPTAGNLGLTENTNTSTGSTATYNYKLKPRSGTLGKGYQFGFTMGYRTNKNLAIELNSSYLKGSKLSSSYSSTGPSNNSKGTDELHYSGLRFTPSLKMFLPLSKTDLYIRAGVVIGIKNKLNYLYESSYSSPYSSSTNEELTVYSGGIAWGYSGGLGLNFKLNDKIHFFTEAQFTAMTWAPKHAELTESTSNGVNQIPTMTVNQKEVEYFKNYTENSNTPPNPGQPNKQLKFYLPLSSVGLNVGLHISLGKK